MADTIYVAVDLAGTTHLVGRLWVHTRDGHESASFEYDRAWLNNSQRFSLEPALKIGAGVFHTGQGKALFGAIGDSAPDRWGRLLMSSNARMQAKLKNQPLQHLREVDFLLQVNDRARQGALRFTTEINGDFLSSDGLHAIPPKIDLPKLLNASDAINSDKENEQDLRILLAPGSSLGGARPKASVVDTTGELLLAKFPKKNDDYNEVLWEAVTLRLAQKAGIPTSKFRIETILDRSVLLVNRFDRDGTVRIPFLSGMSMLGAADHETRSYLELVDALRQYGAHPKTDIKQLWRRIVFNVLASNFDDHMRNHGFLYQSANGWNLSPAYDLNPVPADLAPRFLRTAISLDETSASVENALSVTAYFELSASDVKTILEEVYSAVSSWRDEARNLGLSRTEIERMDSAFEHDETHAVVKYLGK